MKYVLITPVRNEERFIAKTLDSMVAQTFLPERWVIVDDGSTDRTAEIIEKYATRYPWIEVIHRSQRLDRSFAGKVQAFNAGLERVQSLQFDIIGNLDADLSFDPDYLEFLVQKFSENSNLGVAGTPFLENGYDSAIDSFEGENHVAGGCQLFRRQCFKDIGGYAPNRAGGIDWIAVTTARVSTALREGGPEWPLQINDSVRLALCQSHTENLGRDILRRSIRSYYLNHYPSSHSGSSWNTHTVGRSSRCCSYAANGVCLRT